MNETFVNAFDHQTFNQKSNESAILKKTHPTILIFQHLLVKEKVGKVEVDRICNGYKVDMLTTVDICQIVKKGRKVIEIYQGVIYRKKFRISRSKNFIENLLNLRLNQRKEGNDLKQGLVK